MSFKGTQRNVEEPVTEPHTGHGDTVTRHPSFAEISVSRVNGRTNLYGSDFSHNGYVVIRVHESELIRSLSNDRYFGGIQPIMELALSEAQWATFVSSFNMAGVPCTLQYVEGRGRIPELPDPKSRTDQFSDEMEEDFVEALMALDDLKASIIEGTSGVPKKRQEALLEKVRVARAKLSSSAKFVADQFGEHMENEVERAKIEIHGYANSVLRQAGVAAIAGEGPLALSGPEEEA